MIYLLRHGQTDWNLERKIQGHLDMALNETGRKEALICLDKIVSLNIDNIISSDLVRAKETAQIINEKLHLPVRFDSRLREINFGNLQGRLIQDITQDEWDIFNKTPHEVNAESWEDVYLRVKSFFDELDDIKNTLIVTHGGVIRSLTAGLLGLGAEKMLRIADGLEHTSVTELKYSKEAGCFSLERLNDCGHLDGRPELTRYAWKK